MVLTLSMAAVSVYAAEADEASAQAACLHTDRIVKTIIYQEWVPVNDSNHGLRVVDYTCCKTCGAVLWNSAYYNVNVEAHKFGPETYTSNHSGNYTEHSYAYSKTCGVCGKVAKRTGWTGCTEKRCIEPQ